MKAFANPVAKFFLISVALVAADHANRCCAVEPESLEAALLGNLSRQLKPDPAWITYSIHETYGKAYFETDRRESEVSATLPEKVESDVHCQLARSGSLIHKSWQAPILWGSRLSREVRSFTSIYNGTQSIRFDDWQSHGRPAYAVSNDPADAETSYASPWTVGGTEYAAASIADLLLTQPTQDRYISDVTLTCRGPIVELRITHAKHQYTDAFLFDASRDYVLTSLITTDSSGQIVRQVKDIEYQKAGNFYFPTRVTSIQNTPNGELYQRRQLTIRHIEVERDNIPDSLFQVPIAPRVVISSK